MNPEISEKSEPVEGASQEALPFLRGKKEEKEKEVRKRFEKFGLTENPFPPNPFADYAAKERDARRGKIFCPESHIEPIIAIERKWIGFPNFEDKLRIGFLWAQSGELTDKGMGKSSIIFHIIDKVNQGFGINYFKDYKLCAIYVYAGTEWNKLGYVCIEAMRKLENEGILDEVVRILRYESLLEMNPDMASSIKTQEDLNKVLDDGWLSENGVDLAILGEKVNAKLIQEGVEPDVAHAVSERRFIEYLKSFRSDRQLKLPPAPHDWRLTKLSVRLFFDQCMRVLRAGRFDHCYLFIDDVENIIKALEKSSRDLNEFARVLGGHLFRDDVFSNTGQMLSVFLTTHAKAADSLSGPWRDAGYDSSARLHTSSPNSVMVGPLTVEGGIAIVKTYLKHFRIPGYQGDALFPFDLESAQLLVEGSKFHPRFLLTNSFHLLVKAADDDSIKQISRDYVDSFLKSKISIEGKDIESEVQMDKEFGFEH
jgi:hypothetical protein